MRDILLIFAPQWSPLQPPLSLPSLSAWLKRSGFAVRCVDANILFYEWLLSAEAVPVLRQTLRNSPLPPEKKAAYRAVLLSRDEFWEDANLTRQKGGGGSDEDPLDKVKRSYFGSSALESYLAAVSEIAGEFSITTYSFEVGAGSLKTEELEHFASNPPPIIEEFFKRVMRDYVLCEPTRVIGLSCIGQEQLACTLLLGRLIKSHTDYPVLVGGTILPRLFEKGTLKPDWFGKYFDIIVRNEGEKPAEKILINLKEGSPITRNVPGLIYLDAGKVCASEPACPLKPDEIPFPDFDDLPLDRYYSLEIMLPLLSSRGCYWGKCEFCHHGMVYGDKYSAYDAGNILDEVRYLSDRYGVRRFAFNDEAIPPRTVAAIGNFFPDHQESGWTFTGLIKFEKYYTPEHFSNLARVGFRTLYVGLESASDVVLKLMKKYTPISAIEKNLRDATEAGIWMHCFLFFGFPGETEADARLTYDFIMTKSDIIRSFGCGTFSLEHNAPIYRHLETFGLTLKETGSSDARVYYDYEIKNGNTASKAAEWMRKLNEDAYKIPTYRAVRWIPREHLLCLLSNSAPESLIETCIALENNSGLFPISRASDVITLRRSDASLENNIVINRMNLKAASVEGKLLEAFSICLDSDMDAGQMKDLHPVFKDFLSLV